MAVDDWYARQFGERDRIAINLSLSPDPDPCGDPARDATWGGFALWVRGRCLTSSISSDGSVSEEIRWNLLEILAWLASVGVRLINEEPQPLLAHSNSQVRDACDWLNDTDDPPATLTLEGEATWFASRSEWRRHHALRSAAFDVALPNVVLRRLGNFVEVSWDNETWSASQPGLRFVERRGTELVTARRAAAVLLDAVQEYAGAIAHRIRAPELQPLAEIATVATASERDWRWLMHDVTADVIRRDMADLDEHLVRHARAGVQGLYVPHSPETLLLRRARLTSAEEIRTLLGAALAPTNAPMDPRVVALARPKAAPVIRPWLAGYEFASEVRELLHWDNAPAPDLDRWMVEHGIALTRPPLSPAVDLVTSRLEGGGGRATINPSPSTHLRRETAAATALGHLLMDDELFSMDGLGEHWPTSARARAFGIMLLLPREGIRRALAGRERIDATDVRNVMDIFGTGPYATTHHLKNLNFIESNERRDAIIGELVG